MQKKHVLGYVISILIAEGVGLLSSFLSGNLAAEYAQFNKPPFSPPGWLFGVAWAILYLMMGIAMYHAYRHRDASNHGKRALLLYGMQLFVNFMWCLIFFKADMMWVAFGVIILLDILVIMTMVEFRRLSILSFYLMVPYLLWLLFATYLTFGVAYLN